jgi:trafficking protein particle complex subunit 1
MVLYSIYVFNRYGDTIYTKQWKRTSAVQHGEDGLVAGFVYTLQHISSQLSSTQAGGLRAVHTPLYKVHYLETMTGYRVALFTDKGMNTTLVQVILAELMKDVFTRTVTKNPLYRHEKGVLITGNEFEEGMEELFRQKKILS